MFDTLRLAQALRDQAKFPPEQAEAIVKALAASMMKAIPITTQAFDYRLKDLEQRLIIKLGGMMIAGFALVLAAIRYISVH